MNRQTYVINLGEFQKLAGVGGNVSMPDLVSAVRILNECIEYAQCMIDACETADEKLMFGDVLKHLEEDKEHMYLQMKHNVRARAVAPFVSEEKKE